MLHHAEREELDGMGRIDFAVLIWPQYGPLATCIHPY